MKVNCCSKKPVIEIHSGNNLCKTHFVEYFESKVFGTIREFDLIGKSEHLGVAVSGGKDSLTVLHLLKRLSAQNPKIKLTAMLIDEGIEGYRDKTIIDAKEFCNKNKIELRIYSYKDEFGHTLDEGFTKIATGHNLDDECQSILMNQFNNRIAESARLGPKNGINESRFFIQRIKPLYLCTEKEVTAYAFMNGILKGLNECPNVGLSYRAQVRDTLNDMENKFPGTKYSIVNSFLQTLPLLKEKFKSSSPINPCAKCNEPCSNDICNACFYLEKIYLRSEASRQ
ncbi:TIGR00269 family protein [Candidatus Woesearchaeota archaeon]|nr:TIGR00269 family protein [Candidatus Woesearchaeota archaeon]